MSLKYVLSQAGKKIGLNPANASQRETLIRFANEAAEELYDQSDMPGSLMEQVFKVNGDQTIACPYYVGEIRAARELDTHLNWSINKMRPRYNQFNWQDAWRNLRIRNEQALMKTVTNESVGILTVQKVEDEPIVVTISGSTVNASLCTETVVMDSISKETVNQYTDYVLVSKNRINDYDVTLSDIDNNILTVIPNNMLEAVYQIVDVSECPWLAQSQSTTDHYLEILYKKRLPYFSLDGQEFPAKNYDNVWVNKILQLWYEEQNKGDIAAGYDAKASRSMARKKRNVEAATEDKVAFVANPHDTLLTKIRIGRRMYGFRYM